MICKIDQNPPSQSSQFQFRFQNQFHGSCLIKCGNFLQNSSRSFGMRGGRQISVMNRSRMPWKVRFKNANDVQGIGEPQNMNRQQSTNPTTKIKLERTCSVQFSSEGLVLNVSSQKCQYQNNNQSVSSKQNASNKHLYNSPSINEL